MFLTDKGLGHMKMRPTLATSKWARSHGCIMICRQVTFEGGTERKRGERGATAVGRRNVTEQLFGPGA